MDTATTIFTPSTTYVLSDLNVPVQRELPWGDQECDAFVVILDPELMSKKVAEEISLSLVRLHTDWIETMGKKAEFLHDLIDTTSVSVRRQDKVGDGSPMTAWHEDRQRMSDILEYLRLGGHGASRNKLIVVIGPEEVRSELVQGLRRVTISA